ncbi:hypothetical protein PENARI_c094G11392 [Penicillium arizonense]|uniref:Uncharacterized protein n=1 Tax=Penicillium arizonense TaxID=1835702 RepID=A0A1F5L1G9_PENAI|nr:hypothetical protein PENARI_c094G11392 [Penicillium arizonense]OGE46887.1 hypothetical protein PENARI_c094G11392 [Penicillium arizonense]
MSSIITPLRDPLVFLSQVICSVFNDVFAMTSGLPMAAVNFFIGTLKMVLRRAGNTWEAAGGMSKLMATCHIVVIVLIASGSYGYLQYRSRQGCPVKVGNGPRQNSPKTLTPQKPAHGTAV